MTAELIAYVDRWRAKPGATLHFMVSSDYPEYRADVVRLIHGDTNPAGPGFKAEVVAEIGTFPGRKQIAYPGSYVIVKDHPALRLTSCTLLAWIYPTRPGSGQRQVLISKGSSAGGWSLHIASDGALAFALSPDMEITTGRPLLARRWHFIAATFDAATGIATVVQLPTRHLPDTEPVYTTEMVKYDVPALANDAPLLIGAGRTANSESGRVVGLETFDGKIDSPCIFDHALTLEALEQRRNLVDPVSAAGFLAAWDFGRDFDSSHVTDRGEHHLHGRTVNMPMRAVTGQNWTGEEHNFRHAPQQYRAIHFHSDDMEDAGWEVDFSLTVGADWRSGVYAARLQAEGARSDYVPFFVRPSAPSAAVLVLLPTLTYLAYANQGMGTLDDHGAGTTDRAVEVDPLDEYLNAHPEFARSIYDTHSDGSGICYASRLRPIIHLRPDYRMWLVNGPRALGADLYLIDWLEYQGFEYDIATDEDMHEEGSVLLEPYRVLVTGGHPEYWTAAMLDTLEHYLYHGGRMMYLGGNGFYWVTGIDPERPHVLEVRRGIAGTRTWNSAPGEQYLSTSGELGGLWRHRGRAPNRVAGVGFTGLGWDNPSPGFRREAGSFDTRAAFVFEGVGPDEVIGDFGLYLGGAASDELDRLDYSLGSPENTILLASAQEYSSHFVPTIEDVLEITAGLMTGKHPHVRADMVFFETAGGGEVFSTGSISWTGSLSHNNYDNNVSRITENVLRHFTRDRD